MHALYAPKSVFQNKVGGENLCFAFLALLCFTA